MSDWKEREVGALWSYTSNAGNKYSSGYIEVDGKRVQVVVMKNTHKQEGEKTPDARIYLDTKKPESPETATVGADEEDVGF